MSPEEQKAYDELRRRRDKAARMKSRCEGQMRRLRGQGPNRRARIRPPSPTPPPSLALVTAATKPSVHSDPALLHPKERFFSTQVGATIMQNENLTPPLTREQARGMHRAYETTKRLDVSLQITEIQCRIETLTDIRTGKAYRASTDHLGPSGSSLTWHAIAVLIKLVVCFALPLNRVSQMIGHKSFSSGQLFRVLSSQAMLLSKIYLHLAHQLANVSILTGDDTPTRVLAVDEEKKDEASSEAPTESLPNEDKDNHKPSAANILLNDLDTSLGWKAVKKRGDGYKRTLQVSFVMGRPIENDPRSTICFFRTHRGQLGDLLTRILQWRTKTSDLTLQGDLASANVPQTTSHLILAGCGAHARRPFWRYRDQDEELCYFMLRGFNLLSYIERVIDARGRNRYWVNHYRRRARIIWAAMLARCRVAVSGMVDNPARYHMLPGDTVICWPPDTRLHEACMYMINHYPELTRYLDDPRLEYTNNRSERGLRIEVQMLVTSKFRKTRHGRAVLDILRTISTTCNAAEVEIEDYLRFVYQHRADIDAHPERYTPHAFRLELDKTSQAQTANPPQAEASN